MVMIIVAHVVFGLIFGSFANAVVWRLHAQAELKGKKAASRRRELSITKGRSMCSHCGHRLAAKDLVPLFSWLALKGRCRYCQHKIEDSPLLELVVPLAFVAAYLAWPQPLHGLGLFQYVVFLGFIVLAVMLAAYDVRWFILPNKLVYPLVGVAVLQTVVGIAVQRSQASVGGPLLGALVLWGVYFMLWRVSEGKWIGYGDVRLAIGLGLLVGSPLKAFMVIFGSSVIGTLASLPLILKKNLKAQIPYGPFLLLATYGVVLGGTALAKIVYP